MEMDKALIKKTCEIFGITYMSSTLSVNITFDDDGKIQTGVEFDDKIPKNRIYHLSDGSSYEENEVIVGTKNIRNYLIENILNS